MDKSVLKQRMIELETREFQDSMENYRAYLAEARTDPTEPVDIGDHSQAENAGELAEAFDSPVHAHERKIETIKTIDFGPKTSVEPGAVIQLGKRFFVVSVATDSFDCEGETFMGISMQAPVYLALEGMEAGDSAKVNGKTVTIERIF